MQDYLPPLALNRLPYSLPPEEKKVGKKKLGPGLFLKVICPKTTGSVFLYDCKNYCKCRTQECSGAQPFTPTLTKGLSEELADKLRVERDERLIQERKVEEQMSDWKWPDDPEKEPF